MRQLFWAGFLILAAIPIGCSRTRYRVAADRDSYFLLQQKAGAAPWAPPSDFSLHPDPTSRLYDPTPLDDPWLPMPAPQLYAYRLPELPPRTPRGTHPLPAANGDAPLDDASSMEASGEERAPDPAEIYIDLQSRMYRLPPTDLKTDSAGVQLVTRLIPLPQEEQLAAIGAMSYRSTDVMNHGRPSKPARPLPIQIPRPSRTPQLFPIQQMVPGQQELVDLQTQPATPPMPATPPTPPSPPALRAGPPSAPQPAEPANLPAPMPDADQPAPDRYSGDVQLAPIRTDAWEAVPDGCRMRMIEFPKLREEYTLAYKSPPAPDEYAPGQRLSFEEIIRLTLLNSREYQSQKEVLYQTALRLSLERFRYQLKFTPFGTGSTTTWNHARSGGTTVNGLNVASSSQVDKVLASGGDLLARFANNVVMTFNGPTGFAADVSSDLFLQINQTIFQRDIRFENLTQAERNVVYAARDFMRFRKTLFAQVASQYYSLIRTYRQVEIDSQNYFTLVRAFDQSMAEFRTGFLPRFQLDQVEQNVLAGRSRLIATCNSLESAIDNMKIRIGLPTETQVNIDLTELEQLTGRDELAVTGELVRRARERLVEKRQSQPPTRVELLSDSVVLLERMLEAHRLQQQVGVSRDERDDLSAMLRAFHVESARENVLQKKKELDFELNKPNPGSLTVFLRTLDLTYALLELLLRQVEYIEGLNPGAPPLSEQRQRRTAILDQAAKLKTQQERLFDSEQLNLLPQVVQRCEQLRQSVEAAVSQLDRLSGISTGNLPPNEQLQQTLADTDRLLAQSNEMLQNLGGGLTPVEIEMDDAMLTALNLRFDLMNQRGALADTWRRIKYAGDDLKSILRINASQNIGTRADVNRPFDFTFDESNTQVQATFDAPFNRRAERNTYRQALINYQATLRQLMLAEDNIKLSVRNDLRGLSLDKEQYAIEVASAALAYERVGSVRLELRLGIGRVAARDFLEAQNAYASSLSSVAGRHIGYIVDRTQLFLDLELLNVGDDGFWNELYDEQYQPEPYYQLPPYALPIYGELVPGLWYSKYLQRMQQVPPGESAVHVTDETRETQEELVPPPPPLMPE